MKAAAARAWPLVLVFAFAFAATFPAAAKDGEVPALPLLPTRALDVTAPPATREQLAQAKPVVAPHAMVVSAQHLATEIGVRILKQGGNAIDAAVAAGYALAVVHPCCGHIEIGRASCRVRVCQYV